MQICARATLTFFSATFMSLILVACGGGDGSAFQNKANNLNHISTSASTSSVGSGGIDITYTYLNCSALDPAKVYLFGTITADTVVYHALMDLEDPEHKFCVAFEGRLTPAKPTISEAGSLLFLDGNNSIVKMNQEDMDHDIQATGWAYPHQPSINDETLITGGKTNIFVMPLINSADIYTQDTSANPPLIFRNSDSTAYFTPDCANCKLLGVMPDGSLLMSNDAGLYLVDINLTQTPLTSPVAIDGSFKFYSAKLNRAAGTVWVALESGTDTPINSRWTIDLTSQTVTDDGAYAGLPGGITAYATEYKINNSGDLIQLGYSDSSNFAIFQRPLQSSGTATALLYADPKSTKYWAQETVPLVHVDKDSELVTGG